MKIIFHKWNLKYEDEFDKLIGAHTYLVNTWGEDSGMSYVAALEEIKHEH